MRLFLKASQIHILHRTLIVNLIYNLNKFEIPSISYYLNSFQNDFESSDRVYQTYFPNSQLEIEA